MKRAMPASLWEKFDAAIAADDEVSVRQIAEEIIARNPASRKLRIRVARFFLNREEPAEALIWVEGPWVHRNVRALRLRALAFLKLGQSDRAEQEISRSISIASNSIEDRDFLPYSLVVAIDVARQRGDQKLALDRARLRHDLEPENRPFVKREMEILVDLGRLNDARDLAHKIFKTQPKLRDLGLDLVRYLIARNQLEDAAWIIDLAHRYAPDSENAWRLRARIAQADDDFAMLHRCVSRLVHLAPQVEATARLVASTWRDSDPLGAVEFLEQWCANNRPTASIERALIAAHMDAGQIASADELLGTALDRSPEDPQLLLLQARLASEQGDVARSDRQAKKALARDSKLIAAWQLRIKFAVGREDYEKALDLVAQAKKECDGHIGLLQTEAQILAQQGRHIAAVDLLTSSWAESPAKFRLGLQLGQILQNTGDWARASTAFLDVLAQKPDNPEALYRLSELPRTDADQDRFAQHIEARMKFWAERLGSDQPNDIFAMRPALIFAQVTLFIASERSKAATEILKAISVDRPLKTNLVFWLFNLCERCHVPEIASSAIERLIASPQLTPAEFGFVMRHFQQLGAKMPTREATDSLLARVPLSRRGEVRANAYMSCLKPDLALRSIRNASDIPNQHRVTALARALVACGRAPLAYRYIRRNHRHLPMTATILVQFVAMALVAGQHRSADKFLKAIETPDLLDLARNLRVRVLAGMGELKAARALIDDIETEGRIFPYSNDRLRILIGLGDHDAAADFMRKARAALTPGAKQSAHIRLTDFGARLEELRLYSKRYDGMPDALDVSALSVFVPAAQRFIKDRLHEGSVATTGAPVPKRIVQYWDESDPPEEVRELMQSWRTEPDVDHICYDREQAQTYLAEHFDKEHVRAFHLVNNVAEESDFFRLCALYSEGGVYADADDRLNANWSKLVGDRGGMTVFREPYGNIANNILIAPPGHPVLARAIDMAREALLRSDSDITWLKTGPGLLTRAIAVTLAKDGPDVGLTIDSEGAIRRLASIHTPLPHKKTSAHWNRTARETNSHMRAILDKVVEWSDGAAPQSEETGLRRKGGRHGSGSREDIPRSGASKPALRSSARR